MAKIRRNKQSRAQAKVVSENKPRQNGRPPRAWFRTVGLLIALLVPLVSLYAIAAARAAAIEHAQWEARDQVLSELLEISGSSSRVGLSRKDYVALVQRFYATYGRLDVYAGDSLGDCLTTFRNVLQSCTMDATQRPSGYDCDVARLSHLHHRLARDAKDSLVPKQSPSSKTPALCSI